MDRPLATVLAFLLALFTGLPAEAADPEKVVAPRGHQLDLPFSPAVWSGDLLFLSGAIGNPPGEARVDGDIAAQTRQTLSNLHTVLQEAGLGFDRVVSMDIYLTDLREFEPFWKALSKRLGDHIPAGIVVESDLAIPGARIEIAMVAAKPGVEIRSVHPEGWPAPGKGGKWAVRAGDVLFLSGMASTDPATGSFVPGNLREQIHRAMGNVGKVLEAEKLAWKDVARCRVFLPEPADYGPMNDAYGSFLTAMPPARATVRARLLHPKARFGVQCLAVRSADRRVVKAAGQAPSTRPFSPAIRAGSRLYLAGMVGRGADGYPHGVEAQTRITLKRLKKTLEAAGLDFKDVVNAAVYLSDVRYYSAMNAVYKEMVGSPAPARATVGMPLMSPEALVEIQMTADLKP